MPHPICKSRELVRIGRGHSFWSEWRGSNSRPRGPKPRVLSAELHPDIHFSAMIPRRTVKMKFFLSVVIPVVKAAFLPLSAIGENPENAGAARLCGVSPHPVPDTATALPNVARYQLRHTRIGEWGTPPDHGRRTFTISDFLRSCKGEISRSERPSEPPHGR